MYHILHLCWHKSQCVWGDTNDSKETKPRWVGGIYSLCPDSNHAYPIEILENSTLFYSCREVSETEWWVQGSWLNIQRECVGSVFTWGTSSTGREDALHHFPSQKGCMQCPFRLSLILAQCLSFVLPALPRPVRGVLLGKRTNRRNSAMETFCQRCRQKGSSIVSTRDWEVQDKLQGRNRVLKSLQPAENKRLP